MRRLTVVLGATLVMYGCGDDGPTPPAGGANSIALTYPFTDAMSSAGDTRTAVAVVLDASKTPISPAPTVSWSTSAPNVATVTTTGPVATITAVEDGTALITAESGSARGSVTVTVRRRLASVALEAPSSPIILGFDAQLKVVGLDARQHEITGLTDITYSSNNPTTVIVSPTGLVTTLFQFPQTLTATITATAKKDGLTVSGAADIRVTPPSRFDFAALMLTDYEKPTPVPSIGAGIAYFFREPVPGADFLEFLFTWSALSGPATSVRLRGPASPEDVADVLVDIPLTLVPQTANHGTIVGVIDAANIRSQGGRPAISMDSLITLFGSRKLYLEVGTAAFPNGEIRGQTIPIQGQ